MTFYLKLNPGTTENYAEAEAALKSALTQYPGQLTPSGFAPHLPGEFVLGEIAEAIAFLRRCTPVAVPSVSSYSLKHLCEVASGGYVSNGALLVAAIHLQLPITRIPQTPNALVGIDRTQVTKSASTNIIADMKAAAARRKAAGGAA